MKVHQPNLPAPDCVSALHSDPALPPIGAARNPGLDAIGTVTNILKTQAL